MGMSDYLLKINLASIDLSSTFCFLSNQRRSSWWGADDSVCQLLTRMRKGIAHSGTASKRFNFYDQFFPILQF